MDATNMRFVDSEFDVVIDKGTLDALICATDLVLSTKLLSEMSRVLKKEDGKMYIISHGNPNTRMFMFNLAFEVKDYKISYCKECKDYFLIKDFINPII